MCRGVDVKVSQASLFTTIIDLLLLSFISHYQLKRPLFFDQTKLMTFNTAVAPSSLTREGYFSTLPMNRTDEVYLQHLIKAKPSPQKMDNPSNIIGAILMALSPVKLKPPIDISIGIEASR